MRHVCVETLGEIQLSNDVMLESLVIDRFGALYGRDREGRDFSRAG